MRKQQNRSRVFLLMLLFGFGLLACKKENSIPRDKMVDIMTEIQQLEVVLTQSNIRYDDKDSKAPGYYQYILNKYGVSKLEFLENLAIYGENDTLMNALYDEVLEKLNKFKLEVENGQYYSLTNQELGIPDTLLISQQIIDSIVPQANMEGLNIWEEKNIYRIPLEGNFNNIVYNIRPKAQDSLKALRLIFTAKFYPDDQTQNPQATFIAEYANENDSLSIPLKKSGNWELYQLDYKIKPNQILKRLRGSLFESQADSLSRHALFWNIGLYKTQ